MTHEIELAKDDVALVVRQDGTWEMVGGPPDSTDFVAGNTAAGAATIAAWVISRPVVLAAIARIMIKDDPEMVRVTEVRVTEEVPS